MSRLLSMPHALFLALPSLLIHMWGVIEDRTDQTRLYTVRITVHCRWGGLGAVTRTQAYTNAHKKYAS